MNRAMVGATVLMVALMCGGKMVVGKPQLAVPDSAKRLGTALHKNLSALLVAGGLLAGAQLGLPGAATADDNGHLWEEQLSQDVYSSVFYMTHAQAASNQNQVNHVMYVGDTEDGEHLFAGLYMFFLEPWQGSLHLYNGEGVLLADGVARTDIEIFPDPLQDFGVVNLFIIKGLELGEGYVPIVGFPYPIGDVGKDLHLVAYGDDEADPGNVFKLVLRQRECEVADALGFRRIGIGMSTCAPPEGILHSILGAPIFDSMNGNLVGFYGEPVRKGSIVFQNPAFVEFSSGEQVEAFSVDSTGLLATQWGAIKARQ